MLLAALVAMQISAVGPELGAFDTCLLDRSKALIASGTSRLAFRRALAASCADEDRALRRHIVDEETANGNSPFEAARVAESYVRELRAVMEDLLPIDRR